jgi:cell wall-associated protease
MRILIYIILLLLSFDARAGLILNGMEQQLSSDLFSKYQWYLRNQAQTISFDRTDIRTGRTNGVLGADIGWTDEIKYDDLMQRETVVAVIDSGIDWNHEDLKDSIAKNLAECDDGKIPARVEDKDGNGYAGDCMGWDFTAPKDRGQRPNDEVGHGTHLAGIIAAKPNNGIGIRGLSARVKILPLKVLKKRDLDTKEEDDIALRVSKAIDYAVLRKVDVINLSLGWPLHLNSAEIKASFRRALDAGIFIVAAAGNNSNSAMLYPCGFSGVACVAGMDIDGTPSESTNYGGHVDFLAPGEEILSTIPSALGSYFFSIKGYELKGGSSQAGAIVSGVAAILKGIRPNLTATELYRVLALGATHTNSLERGKFVVQGKVNLKKSLDVLLGKTLPEDRAYPELKELGHLVLDKEQNAKIVIPIHGKVTNAKVTELNGFGDLPITLEKNALVINFLKPDLEHDQRLRLLINLDDKIYFHDIYLLRDPATIPGMRKLEIKMDLTSGITTVKDPNSILLLPEYYSFKEEANGIRVFLGRESTGTIAVSGNAFLASAKRVLYLQAIDENLDGSPDYLILAQHLEADGKPSLRIHFLDKNFKPLFGDKYSSWLYYPEAAVILAGKMRFFPWTHPQLGRILVPLLVDSGNLPDRNQDEDPWTPFDQSKRKRVYYYLPVVTEKGIEVQTRVFDSPDFLQELRTRLGLPNNGGFTLLHADSPALGWDGSDQVTIYLGYGIGNLMNYYAVNVRLNGLGLPEWRYTSRFPGLPSLPIFQMAPSFDLNFQRDSSLALFRVQGENTASWLFRNGVGQTYAGEIEIPESQDRLQGPVLLTPNGDALSVFFATSDFVMEQRISKAETKLYKRPLTRVSFLPGQLFNESLYPIAVKTTAGQKPFLYVNAAEISYRALYLIEPTEQGLIAPVKYSYYVPDGCQITNPSEQGTEGKSFVTMFCNSTQNQPYLFHLPLAN